jgi:hypothetical protein
MAPCGTTPAGRRCRGGVSSAIDGLRLEVDAGRGDGRRRHRQPPDRAQSVPGYAACTSHRHLKERLTMHAFDAIDILELVTVTGGDGEPPTTNREQTRASAPCAQDVRRAAGPATDVLNGSGK